jgi:tRNA pseudouridine65 synthase
MSALPILYQDKYLVAVNKPAGLLVHRSELDPRETESAMKAVRDQLGQWVYPFHRLDKATSGVLVFGLDQETARRMTALFTDDRVSKKYLAIVRGYTSDGERIDYALRDRRDTRKHRNAGNENQGKQSVTEYKRLATVEVEKPVGRYSTARYSLLDVKPVTGRMHQIRRHMKHIFHPIIGDTTYGDGKQNIFFREHFNCHRLLLHAHRIDFLHPCNGQHLIIDAPLDDDFNALLKVFQLPSQCTMPSALPRSNNLRAFCSKKTAPPGTSA